MLFGREGTFHSVAAPIHRAIVAQELLIGRVIDAVSASPEVDEALLQELTVVVKTFERPRILQRLLASIARIYPTLEVVVVDDSRKPVQLEGVRTVAMPYDSGVSAGRNEGIRHVTTRYVLIADDDVVFFRHTRLGMALALMERHREIDIMGGQLIELPFLKARWSPEAAGAIFPTDKRPLVPLGSSIGGLPVCAKVPNFFVARRDRLELVPWDAQLKRVEHADFFTRALGTLTTVFNRDVRGLHARTPFDIQYMRSRLDTAADDGVLWKRYRGA